MTTAQKTPTRGKGKAQPRTSSALDLDLAWRRLLKDSRDDLVPDPISYEDFRAASAGVLRAVRSRLRKPYVPSSLLKLDMPKGNLTLRPAAIPVIEDRLVYTALVGAIADTLDSALEDEHVVPSYRVRRGKRDQNLFKFGIDQWFMFQDLIRKGYDDGYRYLLSTDLTAYFDHIDQAVLDSQLNDLRVHPKIRRLIKELLAHWAGREIGIPQGCEPSSLLGNFYLNPLDKHMIRKGYRYFRYVDDIYVFGHSEHELKKAAVEMIGQLRPLGLHVQSAKTKVFKGKEILDLVNERSTALNAIDYDIGIGRPDLALDEATKVFRSLMKPGAFNERHFRKCLNTFRKVKSPIGVPATVKRLDFFITSANQIADYLAPFIRSHPSIARHIIRFLMDDARNIYKWPERWYASVLRGAKSLPREFLDWMRHRIVSSDCHWCCRSEFAFLLAHHGDIADKNLVRDLVISRENDYKRRAFILALKEYPNPARFTLLRKYESDYPQLKPVITLARS